MPYVRKTADILVSEELQEVLHQIKDNSEIARLLLRERHNLETLVDNHVNYISFAKNDKSKISYLTPERFDSVEGNYWGSSKRFIVKPGGLIKKLFKDIPEKEVDKFTTLIRNIHNTPKFTFKVVKGEEIRQWYLYEKYADQCDSLGNSCMKHPGCQKYLNIYVDNSDIITMLIMLDREGNLLGRSLLWDLSTDKIMDRIYTINDSDYQFQFKKWADENGYLYKREQKWNNTLYFESKGVSIYKEISLKLTHDDYRYYPYLDTFKFFDFNTRTFYNYIPKNIDSIWTLSQPDGSRQDLYYLAQDGKTNLFHHHHDTVDLPYLGYRVLANNVQYSDTNNCHVHKEDVYYDEELRDWLFNDISLNNQERLNERKIQIENYKKSQEEKRRRQLEEYVTLSESTFRRRTLRDLIGNLPPHGLLDTMTDSSLQDSMF